MYDVQVDVLVTLEPAEGLSEPVATYATLLVRSEDAAQSSQRPAVGGCAESLS